MGVGVGVRVRLVAVLAVAVLAVAGVLLGGNTGPLPVAAAVV